MHCCHVPCLPRFLSVYSQLLKSHHVEIKIRFSHARAQMRFWSRRGALAVCPLCSKPTEDEDEFQISGESLRSESNFPHPKAGEASCSVRILLKRFFEVLIRLKSDCEADGRTRQEFRVLLFREMSSS